LRVDLGLVVPDSRSHAALVVDTTPRSTRPARPVSALALGCPGDHARAGDEADRDTGASAAPATARCRRAVRRGAGGRGTPAGLAGRGHQLGPGADLADHLRIDRDPGDPVRGAGYRRVRGDRRPGT